MTLLSILVPALSTRPWQMIVDELERQASSVNCVEVLVEVDSGEMTSGRKRNLLMSRARGQYICQCDDDDWIDPEYVSCLLEGCRLGIDVVTFRMTGNRTRERWRLGLHVQDRRRGQMTVNHLCAWKRELATKVAFCDQLGYADDQLWWQPLYFSGLAKTEFHVDKVLYRYQFDQRKTANQTNERRDFARQYVGGGLGCFRQGDELLVEVGGCERLSSGVVVRDRNNIERFMPIEDGQLYHTIAIA